MLQQAMLRNNILGCLEFPIRGDPGLRIPVSRGLNATWLRRPSREGQTSPEPHTSAVRLCSVGQGPRCRAGREGRQAERSGGCCLPGWKGDAAAAVTVPAGTSPQPERQLVAARALRAALGIHPQSSLGAEMRMRSFREPSHSDSGLLQALLQKPQCCALLDGHVSRARLWTTAVTDLSWSNWRRECVANRLALGSA